MDENLSSFDEQLLEAYQLTRYWVDDPLLFLSIGAKNALLDTFLSAHQYASWAYLTAYNPQSQQLSKPENQQRHHKLCQLLGQKAFSYTTGRTEALRKDWPAEESLLIWDISLETARQIAQGMDQMGFLFGIKNAPAELILLPHTGVDHF